MPGFSGINGYFSFRYQVRATLVLQNTPKLVPGCKIPIDSGIRRGIPREGDTPFEVRLHNYQVRRSVEEYITIEATENGDTHQLNSVATTTLSRLNI